MAVQIVSDLHLEAPKTYDIFDIVPRAPYLALLGDIGSNLGSHRDAFFGFLTRQLRQFRVVLLVPGNHEAYHSSWPYTLALLRAFEQQVREDTALGEFILLDRTVFRLPGTNVVILGCSLFSRIPPESHIAVSLGLQDFYQTSDWDVEAHNAAHRRDVTWLNEQVAGFQGSDVKIIILSHWSPTRDARGIEPRHINSTIGSAFHTDLRTETCFRSGQVKLWAFGHSHYNCDFVVERGDGAPPLRLVTNQRGYSFSQAAGYDAEKTVEI